MCTETRSSSFFRILLKSKWQIPDISDHILYQEGITYYHMGHNNDIYMVGAM